MKVLKNALEKSLNRNEIPKEWLKEIWPGNHEYYRKQKAKYESCRSPLSLTAGKEIQTIFKKILGIETAAGLIKRRSRRNIYLKDELAKICRYALNKAWKIAGALGLENL